VVLQNAIVPTACWFAFLSSSIYSYKYGINFEEFPGVWICTPIYAVYFAFFLSFYNKDKFYGKRLTEMLRNKTCVKTMKKSFPVGDVKLLKWRFSWYD